MTAEGDADRPLPPPNWAAIDAVIAELAAERGLPPELWLPS